MTLTPLLYFSYPEMEWLFLYAAFHYLAPFQLQSLHLTPFSLLEGTPLTEQHTSIYRLRGSSKEQLLFFASIWNPISPDRSGMWGSQNPVVVLLLLRRRTPGDDTRLSTSRGCRLLYSIWPISVFLPSRFSEGACGRIFKNKKH